MNNFSEILKKLRESNGLTQSQLASILSEDSNKVLPQNISYWEKGRQPSLDILNKLADYFKVTTDYLTGRSSFKDFKEEYYYKANIDKLKTLFEDQFNNIPDSVEKALIDMIDPLNKALIDFLLVSSNEDISNILVDFFTNLVAMFKILTTISKNNDANLHFINFQINSKQDIYNYLVKTNEMFSQLIELNNLINKTYKIYKSNLDNSFDKLIDFYTLDLRNTLSYLQTQFNNIKNSNEETKKLSKQKHPL